MTLQARQLTCIRGNRPLFSDLDFALQAGDALQIAGQNGCGKTSLLRMLAGLTQPTSGQIFWHGRDIVNNRENFNRNLLHLGHAAGIKDDLRAWENLALAGSLAGISVSRADAAAALEAMGIAALADLPARVLSQGQRKRVALTRLQFSDFSKLWILDEPFAALDQRSMQRLCAWLNAHLARGGMLVYTTHQEVELNAQRSLRIDLGTPSNA